MCKDLMKNVACRVLSTLLAAFIIFLAGVMWSKIQPEKIDISPQEIIKHLYKADTFLHSQQIAEQLYIGKYVEWEITIDEIYPKENGAAAITGLNVKAIFKNSKHVSPYKKGMTLVIEGRIIALENDATIVIDKCRIVKFK